MGEKQYPTGVRPYGSGIQVRFSWNKQRYEPIWPRKPTQKNITAAAHLRAEIILRAKSGMLTLEYLADHFPEYSHTKATHEAENDHLLFHRVAQKYLDSLDLSLNTKRLYRSTLQNWWMDEFALVDIRDITTGQIKVAMGTYNWPGQPTKQKAFSVLNCMFQFACDLYELDNNPCSKMSVPVKASEVPDPFTPEERDTILRYMDENLTGTSKTPYYFYAISFWTGMRPGEILALTWKDVDFDNQTITVNKHVYQGKLYLHTKTKRPRTVYMNPGSMSAFRALREFNDAHSRPTDSTLFYAARRAHQPWVTSTAASKRFNEAVNACGVRQRSSYNTRHTYATVCIMAGMKPAFISRQLGNTVQVLISRYALWLESSEDMSEMAKLGKSWETPTSQNR